MSHQFFQLLKSISASLFDNEKDRTEAVLTMAVIITFIVTTSISTNKCNEIEQLWIFSACDNKDYTKAWQTIKDEARQFLPELNLKASITECQANNDDTLQFRNWHWALKLKPLQTALIHDIHTFIQTDHTNQYNTYNILIHNFF